MHDSFPSCLQLPGPYDPRGALCEYRADPQRAPSGTDQDAENRHGRVERSMSKVALAPPGAPGPVHLAGGGGAGPGDGQSGGARLRGRAGRIGLPRRCGCWLAAANRVSEIIWHGRWMSGF